MALLIWGDALGLVLVSFAGSALMERVLQILVEWGDLGAAKLGTSVRWSEGNAVECELIGS